MPGISPLSAACCQSYSFKTQYLSRIDNVGVTNPIECGQGRPVHAYLPGNFRKIIPALHNIKFTLRIRF